jgi:Group 4 capsule polysaccharide lipoprotein gfcB, YjbF
VLVTRSPALCLGLAAFVLAGCGSAGTGYGDYFKLIRQGFGQSFGHAGVTLDQAAKIPYASMGWRLNGSNESIIVLATQNGGEMLWTSAAHIVLLTQDGLLKRTVGLPHDLSGLSSLSGRLTSPARALQGPYLDIRAADFPNSNQFGVQISCRGHSVGARTIKILGKTITTMRVEEDCEAPSLGWTFKNIFWLDRDNGLAWRTSQQTYPGQAMQTEILRPPG